MIRRTEKTPISMDQSCAFAREPSAPVFEDLRFMTATKARQERNRAKAA